MKYKYFIIFVMLLVTADVIYIYYTTQEFNVLYWPSVMALGYIALDYIKKLEAKE